MAIPRPVLVALLALGVLGLLATLRALFLDPGIWRFGSVAISALLLLWVAVVAQRQWRAAGRKAHRR